MLTSYYNPCLPDRWNVLCIVYDTKHPESSAVWLNNGKLLNFTCPTAKESGQLNLFSRDFKDEKAFHGYIALTEICPHFTSIPEGFTSSRMMALCVDYLVAMQAHNEAIIKRAIAYREKQCFICYRISDDESTVVLSDKAVLKFLNYTKYSEPDWHFTACRAGHAERSGEHGYHLDIKNSAYLTPYKLVDNFVHAIYIVYKKRDYSFFFIYAFFVQGR